MRSAAFPELFGDFLAFARLGENPMADVLFAIRLGDRSGKAFVLKRPKVGQRASERAAQSIAREAEVLSLVRCPSIVALEAAGEIAGLPYVATEYVRGVSLDELRNAGIPLSGPAVRAIALDVSIALSALHEKGFVHGDISPSNILIDDTGEIRVCDFGVAEKAGTKRSAIAGKPGYIAPEAVRPTESNPAEDMYGLGVVIAECALQKRLFMESSLADAGARADVPAYESALEDIASGFGNALKRDPSARPKADELAKTLKALPIDRGELAHAVAQASEASQDAKRSAELSAAAPAHIPTPTPSPAALTPTIPMKLATLPETRADESRKTNTNISVQPSNELRQPKSSRSSESNGWRTLALFLLAFVIAVGSFAAGRLTGRFRGASVHYGAPLAKRSQLELDGRKVDKNAGPIPIEPGKHTLVLTTAKGDRREISFSARPGEQVVLVPINKQGNSIGLEEDRGE